MYFHTMYIDVRKRGAYMKIGDFARKYDMNVTTVRYYVAESYSIFFQAYSKIKRKRLNRRINA